MVSTDFYGLYVPVMFVENGFKRIILLDLVGD